MLDRAVLHLTIIAESISAIRTYIADLDQPSFSSNPLVRDAVAMNFQIIGEAARNLVPNERAEAPEIPWPKIVSLRHRISHDYRNINWNTVWNIVHNELDTLDAAVRRMLAARGEGTP